MVQMRQGDTWSTKRKKRRFISTKAMALASWHAFMPPDGEWFVGNTYRPTK